MRLQDKIGKSLTEDERCRKVMFPSRVVLTKGNVKGSENLLKNRSVQVSIYNYHDECVLDNRGSTENAAVLIDFGMEIHGTLTVSLWSMNRSYASYTIRFGESVSEAMTPIEDGNGKNPTNDHANRDIKTGSGPWSSNETNESGFRFAYVELTTPDAYIQVRCITATLIYRDIEYIGTFECNDTLLNRIFETAAYTTHLNMQRYLWDGIKRDRLVWAGDMNTEIATILAVFGENEVVPKSLDFVRDITPVGQPMNGMSSYNLWWLLCQYEWYIGTGNIGYLRQQKDYISGMLLRYLSYIGEDGSEQLPEQRFFDWPTNEMTEEIHAGLQGLMCIAFLRGSEIMNFLGDVHLSKTFRSAYEKLGKHKPISKTKQASALLSISGICDPTETYEKVIGCGGVEGLSTFLGYYTLCACAEAGKYRESLDMIRGYWGKMLELGATTFWEDFNIRWADNASPIDMPVPDGKADIHGDFGAHCYRGLRHSLCHGWASGPAPYLSRYILGIQPVEPGCKKIRFSPNLAGLEWAKGTYPTPYGEIRVEITKNSADCELPSGIEMIR